MNNKRRCGSMILSLCAILCVLSACAPSAQAPTPADTVLSLIATPTRAPGQDGEPLRGYATPEELAMAIPDLRVPTYIPPEFDPKLNPEVNRNFTIWFPGDLYTEIFPDREYYEIRYAVNKDGQEMDFQVHGWAREVESNEFPGKENYVRVDLDDGFTFYEQKTTEERAFRSDRVLP